MNPITNATLSNAAYETPSSDGDFVTIAGIEYEVLATRNSSTGYQGTVYRNIESKEIIVAHRGTEFDRQALIGGGIDAAMVTAKVNA